MSLSPSAAVKDLEDERIIEITTRFGSLTTQQVSQVSTKLENFGDIVPVVLDILRKSTNPETKDTFCIPAMLVAGVAGRKYTSSDHQADFVRNVLRDMGQKGQDWASLPKSEVFGGVFHEYAKTGIDSSLGIHLEFGYDCMEEGPVLFHSKCGPSSKFYFVTPLFALRLLMKMQSKRQGKYVDCFIAMGQAVQVVCDGGQVQIGDKTLGQVTAPALSADELEMKRLEITMKYECKRQEFEYKKQELECRKQELEARSKELSMKKKEMDMKEINFYWDFFERVGNVTEVEKIEFKSYANNIMKRNRWNEDAREQRALAEQQQQQHVPMIMNAEDPNEFISHIDEAAKILGRRLSSGESSTFGRTLKNFFIEEFEEHPPKRNQVLQNGRVAEVYSYQRRHLDLIRQAVEFWQKENEHRHNDHSKKRHKKKHQG